MSGGSFNYLCYAEPEELFNKRADLKAMVEALSNLGYTDAAAETETITLILNHFEARMRARLERLTPVWKAMEWVQSGDSGPEYLGEEIARYRKEVELTGTANQVHMDTMK